LKENAWFLKRALQIVTHKKNVAIWVLGTQKGFSGMTIYQLNAHEPCKRPDKKAPLVRRIVQNELHPTLVMEESQFAQ